MQVIEKADGLAWNVYAENKWYSPKLPANLNEEKIVQVESIKADFRKLPIQNCHKVLLIGSVEQISKLEPKLVAQFPDLSIVKSSPFLLEIMAQGIQKGAAVKRLIDYYHMPHDNTWAFGDNYNDLEMLKVVSHSVAMGNAPAEVKNVCDLVTQDNNHDGIANALK